MTSRQVPLDTCPEYGYSPFLKEKSPFRSLKKEPAKELRPGRNSNPSRLRDSLDDQGSHSVYFSHDELNSFVKYRSRGITRNSVNIIKKVGSEIWSTLNGVINTKNLEKLSDFFIAKCKSVSALEKCFNYTRAFFNYLYKLTMNPKILSYHSIFERPKNRQPIKLLTSRIIVQEDIQKALNSIASDSELTDVKRLNYQSLILFLSYSGQRTITASRLTVSQFKTALERDPHVLTVDAEQDKIRLQHYVPLHPVLIPIIEKIITGKNEDDLVFDYLGLQRWLKYHPISMSHTKGKLQQRDLRKFFEQKSDEIGFTDANKNFIMSHGVSSINWSSYKQFLPETVYNRYMACWANVNFND